MNVIVDKTILEELRPFIEGELHTDEYLRGLYATDASHYQAMPIAVVLPKHSRDIIATLEFSYKNRIPVLMRGGGTSLSGQTVAEAIVIDVSKYHNKIIEYNKEEKWIKVQPGIILDSVNDFLINDGLVFPPDPATASRANIGGMIANNSSGTKSILYGKTSDHVIELKIALISGQVIDLKVLPEDLYNLKCEEDSTEGKIYNKVRSLVYNNTEEIEDRFPKTMRRVSGYALDSLMEAGKWNLCRLICGSEGTLGCILEAKLNLVELPKYKAVVPIHFDDELEAINAVTTIVKHGPSAVESLDKVLINMSRKNLETRAYTHFIEGNPVHILIVEFYGETESEVKEKSQRLTQELKSLSFGYAYPIFTDIKLCNDVWEIRKKGLGLLLSRNDTKKAVAVIEDAAVPLEHLADYTSDVMEICNRYGVELAIYGHASVGVLHLRPFLDMMVQEDVEKFKKISQETFEVVKKYNGSWSSEHGDGRVRSPYIKKFYGDKIYEAFREIKEVFDPHYLLNPGNIIDAPPLLSNLRYQPEYKDAQMNTVFKYRQQGSFQKVVHDCTGVGECRKTTGGIMCPSFRATRDEEHSTRGRANALRLAMSGQLSKMDLASDRILESLDLCLSCKACKAECPSSVDMAKLKSEVLQRKYDAGKISRREKFIRDSNKMAKLMSGTLAPLVNKIQQTSIFRNSIERFSKISKHRTLPAYSSFSLLKWYKENYTPPIEIIATVGLFADTYLKYHEPKMAIAIIDFLTTCGYEVLLLDVGCCQRPRISNGFLRKAKEDGSLVAESLIEQIEKGIKILVSEPSCASALQDDIPDLLENVNHAESLKNNVMLVTSFIAGELRNGNIQTKFISKSDHIIVHGHCHEKSLYGMKDIATILDQVENISYEILDTGCCGMAGSFGYESEHYDLSVKIAEESILPQLKKNKKASIVSSGFSCRHQIKDLSDREGHHLCQLIEASGQ